MKAFKDRVAVVTGAASGIGFGIADRCAQMGMKVVLAGVNDANLATAEEKLKPTGAAVFRVQADVAKREDVERLARQVLERFGAVHLLVNNAGVLAGTSIWESNWEDWEWVLNVNLWGVINGVKVFVPIMLAQDTEAHIVNVASVAGLLPSMPSAPYQVAKHAVVALSESLYYSLAEQKAQVRVSVLCPGFVKTAIMGAERSRPPELQGKPADKLNASEPVPSYQWLREQVDGGMPVQEFTDRVFHAIQAEQFYVLSHPEFTPDIQKRMENILQQMNPL